MNMHEDYEETQAGGSMPHTPRDSAPLPEGEAARQDTEVIEVPSRHDTQILPVAQPIILPEGHRAEAAEAAAGHGSATASTSEESAASQQSAFAHTQPAPSFPPRSSAAPSYPTAASAPAPHAKAAASMSSSASAAPAYASAAGGPSNPAPAAAPAAGSAASAAYAPQAYAQPWQAPSSTRKPASTRLIAGVSGLALALGGLMGSGAIAIADYVANSFGSDRGYTVPLDGDDGDSEFSPWNDWDAIPDYGNGVWGEDGTDPFFPDGFEGSSGTRVDSAPGVLLINSMLTGGIGAGSGMIISEDGYALTNYHVVEGSTTVRVTIADSNESYTATVLGHDASEDVALLKLEGAEGLDYVEFASGKLKKGDAVYAVGNAGGQGYLSRVDGEVTDLDRNITAMGETGEDSEELTGLIETDADIVQGYSGGPLFDEDGKVVGMVVAASSSWGSSSDTDGFAIPAASVKKVADQIQSGESSGSTRVGPNAALGITVVTAGQDGQRTNLRGATVIQVNSGSAAEKAGIEAGDTITEVNGTSIRSASELSSLVKTFSIGDEVEVTLVTQNGKEKQLTVNLGESPVN